MIFFSQAYLNLWFVSKITGMWIWAFYCCNKSHHHKLIAVLAICGFTIPLYPPGLVYWTHLFFPKSDLFWKEDILSEKKALVILFSGQLCCYAKKLTYDSQFFTSWKISYLTSQTLACTNNMKRNDICTDHSHL